MAMPKNSLKSLLVLAWRERWSDMQWSINVKRLLATSGNTDSSQLAELLLQQALVGSSPNHRYLCYLRHATSTQMVTYAAAIQSLIKHDDMNRPHCIRSLLEFVQGFSSKIIVYGTYEDSLPLARALVALLKWSLDIVHKALLRFNDDRQSAEYPVIVMKASAVCEGLLANDSSRAMIYIARLEEAELYHETEKLRTNIQGIVSQLESGALPNNAIESMNSAMQLVDRIPCMLTGAQGLLDVSQQPLNLSLNALLTLEAELNPTNDVQMLVQQILVIESTQGLQRSDLYCELFRTSLLGLIDSHIGTDDFKWVAFTFLKLPQVFGRLIKLSTDPDKLQLLETGIENLLNFVPLLDLADTRCNCDCLQYLLNELMTKCGLLKEAQCQKLMTKRKSESQKPQSPDHSGQQPSVSLILRAEPTVQSILKTLDADYSKNQEALLGVLCHMLSGKSFELIMAAAAATGKLQSFVIKLIKFNEFAKQSSAEGGKAAQTRALLFDITFLMLCNIMQLYGVEIISSSPDANGSFFAQWTQRCLPEDGKYKSPQLIYPGDPAKVEMLLTQFNPGGEIKTNLTSWQDVCQNAPFAIQEVLFAWEHGAITADTVKTIMENVKGHMCCLPVVVSAWVCSYINMIDDDIRIKPRNILQMLIKPIQPDATNQYYSERSVLMSIIMRRMITGIWPPSRTSPSHPPHPPHTIPPNVPAYTLLMETFRAAFNKGCVDIKAVHKFENLCNIGGPQWFCDHLVKEMLSHDRPENLHRAASLVYALFHLDMAALTLCLVHNTLPRLLQGAEHKLNLLTDPRGRTLAQLTVMCLMVTDRMKRLHKEAKVFKRGKKRPRAEIEIEDIEDGDERPSKMRRLPLTEEAFNFSTEGFNFSDLLGSSRDEPDVQPSYDTKEPLNKALVKLFRVFSNIVLYSAVSQKTGFVMTFMTEAVKSGPETARFIFQFMPTNMVMQMMKCLPAEFTPELLLSICDLSASNGRKVATRVITHNAKYIASKQREVSTLEP